MESINQAVAGMKVGAVNAVITRFTFRHMLLKRAYTKSEFEQMISRTRLQSEIRENLLGLEIVLSKPAKVLAFNYF